ncbi:efflux RND transporter periplasmic adaptor subunit [Peristeroidobacter agariperforans]|uniref:efflux RND transporter periplasmic adaptor subunit n=1 Tax=Peristeroidobacter agariperforans TaxID=268404 RepID=UPI00101BD795|nr:efflux RND transporter periplasmic adaptor subunit [Peristeroidobacter agariperforans]
MLRLSSRPARSIIVIAIVALGGWFLFDREHAPQATTASEAAVDENGGVTLDSVQTGALGLQTEAAVAATTMPISGLPAEVAPPLDSSARIAAPYAGVVTRILRDEGDVVAKGDALVRIQSRELLSAQAELVRARSDAIAVLQQAERNELLLKEGIIAASRNEESRARAAAAEAALQQAEGALSGLRTVAGGVPGEYELLAPIAGQVLRRRVVPGQAVAALEETYAVAAPGSLDLMFSVPVSSRSRVAPGMQVRLPDGSSGSVVAVGADTDRASQRLRVRARAEDDRGLVAGQHIELTLLAPAPTDSIGVPTAALITEGDGHVLYVLAGKTYRAVRVERLGGDRQQAIVRGDVRAGDQVVVQGASALKPLLAAE